MCGFSGMWDEASQRARAAAFKTAAPKAQSVVEVFVMLASIFSARDVGGGKAELQWQPWLSAPLLVSDTKHITILSALEAALPFKFTEPETLLEFGSGVDVAIICFGFDMASSNAVVYNRIVRSISALPDSGQRILLHCER